MKNSAGHAVRTIQARKTKGRHVLAWNGRNSANHIVAAGKYHWTFSQTDAAGNTRTTDSRAVYVSAKRLVLKKKVVTRAGSSYALADHGGCGGSVSKANSTFQHGVLLSVSCGSRAGGAITLYHVRLPDAIRYRRMSLEAYGYSHRGYAGLGPWAYSTGSQDYERMRSSLLEVTSSSTGWRNLGSVRVAGHYTRGHMAHFVFGVYNTLNHPADFDLRYIRITVGCYVLR